MHYVLYSRSHFPIFLHKLFFKILLFHNLVISSQFNVLMSISQGSIQDYWSLDCFFTPRYCRHLVEADVRDSAACDDNGLLTGSFSPCTYVTWAWRTCWENCRGTLGQCRRASDHCAPQEWLCPSQWACLRYRKSQVLNKNVLIEINWLVYLKCC